MKDQAIIDDYGVLTAPATLTIQRTLPGPIERVWDYLVQSDLRRKWLAAGSMTGAGEPFEFIWRNDELTDPPGAKPDGFSDEHRMNSRVTEMDPPRRLSFTWNNSGDVSIDLEPRGKEVLLTLVHRQLPDRSAMLSVSAGWHSHLDILAARVSGAQPEPFWDRWAVLKNEYESRFPA